VVSGGRTDLATRRGAGAGARGVRGGVRVAEEEEGSGATRAGGGWGGGAAGWWRRGAAARAAEQQRAWRAEEKWRGGEAKGAGVLEKRERGAGQLARRRRAELARGAGAQETPAAWRPRPARGRNGAREGGGR
jgi:hypothetical protein